MKKFIVACLVLSGILILLYTFFFSHKIHPVVQGSIYRSSQLSGKRLEKLLQDNNIRSILNLRGDSESEEWYKREKALSEKYRIALYDIGISSRELPECRFIKRILDVLLHAEKPLLIHCHKGADRTGLVSAIALSIQRDAPLPELRKQFSFRYGVLPFYESVGPAFFSQYEDWLKKNHRNHSRDNLLHWMQNDYHDSSGNVKFLIDHVNGKLFLNNKATIPDTPEKILIGGWAYDECSLSPAEQLYLKIDDSSPVKVIYKINRPDVARAFHLGEERYQTFVVGWEVEYHLRESSSGCHRVSLQKIIDNAAFSIPGEYTLCFKK